MDIKQPKPRPLIFLKVDKDGYIINEKNTKLISNNWNKVLEDIKSTLKKNIKDQLHSSYVIGNFLNQKLPNDLSDIEIFIVTFKKVSADWLNDYKIYLKNKYPFIKKVVLKILNEKRLLKNEYYKYPLKTKGFCITGKDLIPELPGYKPYWNAEKLWEWEEPVNWIEDLDYNRNDQEHIIRRCKIIMKIMLFMGFKLCMEKEKKYSLDLYTCYKIFSKYFPDKEIFMRRVYFLCEKPTKDCDEIIEVINGIGLWLFAKTELESLEKKLKEKKEIITSDLPPDQNELVVNALKLLKERDKNIIKLDSAETIRNDIKALIIRCRIKFSNNSIPRPILIKRMEKFSQNFFTECASLYFVNIICKKQIVPKFYGCDPIRSFLIIQDIENSKTLEDVLRGKDKLLLEKVTLEIADITAELHLSTINREESFIQIRKTLPPDIIPSRESESKRWLEKLKFMKEWFLQLRCPFPAGFEDCLLKLSEFYSHPKNLLVFTNREIFPLNIITGKQTYFAEFTEGAYRHGFSDIMPLYYSSPLPDYLFSKLLMRYKSYLSKSIYKTQEEFIRDWAYISAWYGMTVLMNVPVSVLHKDKEIGRSNFWTTQKSILLILSRLLEAIKKCSELKPIEKGIDKLKSELESRWKHKREELFPKW